MAYNEEGYLKQADVKTLGGLGFECGIEHAVKRKIYTPRSYSEDMELARIAHESVLVYFYLAKAFPGRSPLDVAMEACEKQQGGAS